MAQATAAQATAGNLDRASPVARERQLRAASRSLGVDSSTVSRRLSAAEERLQVRLFIRDPEGYKPTDAGKAFIAAAEEIERTVLSIFQTARETAGEVRGPVRITSVDALLNDWLTEKLPTLLEAYPGLEIRLLPDNHNLSFARSEADLRRMATEAFTMIMPASGLWLHGSIVQRLTQKCVECAIGAMT